MSAYLVDPEHIHVLLYTATQHRPGHMQGLRWYWGNPTMAGKLQITARPEEKSVVGQMLMDQNAASVNARYDEDHAYVYEYQRPRFVDWQPIEVLKAIHCYEYQACETNDWPQTEAHAFCRALEHDLIARIAGYSDAETWSITYSSMPTHERKHREVRAS